LAGAFFFFIAFRIASGDTPRSFARSTHEIKSARLYPPICDRRRALRLTDHRELFFCLGIVDHAKTQPKTTNLKKNVARERERRLRPPLSFVPMGKEIP
jgi:hypothetical protein